MRRTRGLGSALAWRPGIGYRLAMAIALSLMVLASMALVLGSLALWRRPGHRKRAVLMLVLAGIMAINVAILTVPTPDGRSLAGIAETQEAPQ